MHVLFVRDQSNDKPGRSNKSIRAQCIYISVKHTANILRTARYTSIRMSMVMMQLGASHADRARLRPLRGCSHRIRTRSHPCSATRTAWATWTSQVGGMTCLHLLAIVDFGHSPNPSTTQSRILVAISPAIHCSLDQSSLSAQAWIQLRKCPAHRVAFRLINKAIATVLILLTAGPRIHTILGFEFGTQTVHIDGFHIASDGVFHLYSISRVLESDPLDPIVVLTYDKRSGCWYRPRRRVRIYPATPRRTWMQPTPVGRWTSRRIMILSHRAWRRPLECSLINGSLLGGFKFRSRAVGHAWSLGLWLLTLYRRLPLLV